MTEGQPKINRWILDLPWKRRNEAIMVATQAFLLTIPKGTILTTKEVSNAICAEDIQTGTVGSILTRLAAKVFGPSIATHDGETFYFCGKANQRWNWHGQKTKGDGNEAV